MKARKVMAVVLSVAMAFSGATTVFADGVTGTGAVEYDNSTEVEITSVTVPTIAASTYDMTLDPTKLLHEYDPDTYESSTATVLFQSIKTKKKLDVKTTKGASGKVYTKDTSAVAAANVGAKLLAYVDTITVTNGKVTAATITSTAKPLYVWTPKKNASNEPTGEGELTQLTAANILKYVDITFTGTAGSETKSAVAVKAAHLAGDSVCDGNIYEDVYTELTADEVDFDTADTYYSDDNGTAYAASDLTAIDAVTQFSNTTDKVKVTNKTTKDVYIKAVVTLNNAAALKMNSSTTFETDDDTASLYVAATNGTNTFALAKASDDADTATATYSVKLNKPTYTEITYQGGINAATGGHDYLRYLPYGMTGGSDEFYITAAANSNAAAADAWAEYGKDVTATTRPTLNIVYTASTAAAPSVASTMTYSVADGTGAIIAYNLGSGVMAGTEVTAVLWGTSADDVTNSFRAGLYSIDATNNTVTVDSFDASDVGTTYYIGLVFDDTAETKAVIAVTIAD